MYISLYTDTLCTDWFIFDIFKSVTHSEHMCYDLLYFFQVADKNAIIYIKDNGYSHNGLRSRAFGSYASLESDYPIIDINGRELARTWSLLAKSLTPGDTSITLMHRADLMGW